MSFIHKIKKLLSSFCINLSLDNIELNFDTFYIKNRNKKSLENKKLEKYNSFK